MASLRSSLAICSTMLLFGLSCGGSRDATSAPGTPAAQPATDAKPPAATPPASDTGGIGAPNIPWKDKTRAQRLDYMGVYVLDQMGALFKEWKPDEFAGKGEDGKPAFRCQVCHGDNFDKPEVDFHMPRVAFPLDPKDPIGKAMQYNAAATKFMQEKVVPTMAKLLAETPMADGGTFGCFRCHPKKGEKVP